MAFTLLLGTLTSCGGSDMSSSMPPPPSGGGGTTHTPAQPTDVVTYKNDVGRTGANVTESVLTPANVNSTSFGKLRTLDDRRQGGCAAAVPVGAGGAGGRA